MFTFLNSVLLLALPAALLPIIIYLLNRHKLVVIPYSTLRFLKQMHEQRMRKVKLYHWLLLAIRTLIILLAVLAFGRPALKGVFTAGVGAHAASTVVILLDNSLSMQTDTRQGVLFDLAKAKAKEILALLKPEDNAHLVVFSDQVTFVNEDPTHNAAWLGQVLERTTVTYRGTNTAAALKTAYALLDKSHDLNREIYVISDLARHGWQPTGADSAVLPQKKKVNLYLFRLAENQTLENCGLADVRLDRQIITAGQPVRARVRAANYGDEPAMGVPVQLELNDRRVNETAVDLAPHAEQEAGLPALLGAPGWYRGTVVLGDDALAADNRRYFAISVPAAIPLLLVGEQGTGSSGVKYLRYALAPTDSSRTLIAPRVISRRDLGRQALDDFSVVMVDNVASFSDPEARELRRYCEQGGNLVVWLGDRADLRAYSSFFKNMNLGQIADLRGTPGQREGFVSFGSFAAEHPVFRDFFTAANLTTAGPRVYAYCQMVAPATADRLVRFSNNDPALLEARCGKGRVVLFPFDVDPAASNLALKACFVPLVTRLVQYLATDLANEGNSIMVGDRYTRWLEHLDEKTEVVCRTPLGEVFPLPRQQQDQGQTVTFQETEIPGIYTLTGNGQLLAAFAVNVDPRESDLAAVEAGGVARLAPGAEARFIKPGVAPAQAVLENRYGREMYGQTLWLVAALLVAEMLIARRRKYVKEEFPDRRPGA